MPNNLGYKSQLVRVSPPWLLFLFLIVIFFLVHHQIQKFSFQIPGELDITSISGENIAKSIETGDPVRKVALISLGLYGFFYLIFRKRQPLRPNGILGSLILFFLIWAFISLFWAQDLGLTFRRLALLAMLCLGAVAIADRLSLRELIILTFFGSGIFLMIGIMAELVSGTFYPLEVNYRFSGTLHPNHQGWNCSMLLISSIFFVKLFPRRRIIFIIIALISFTFLVLTKSRTAFICTIISTLIYMIYVNYRIVKSSKSSKILCIGIVAWLLFSFCMTYLLIGNNLIPTLQKTILLGRTDTTLTRLTGRIPVWGICIEFLSARPLLGYGYNSFWDPDHVLEISKKVMWGVPLSHNGYLDIGLGLGAIGAITYILILIFGIKYSFILHRKFQDRSYFFCLAIIVFYSLAMLTEVIASDANLTNFIVYSILAKLGFMQLPHQ